MIKIDLITGFLGSGKTTFIKKYARYLMNQGMNIGILENDYGAVNVDMMLLQELEGDQCDLEMVAGACDEDCHRRRFKTKLIALGMLGYDRVLVEPSGIFDVDEFFDAIHESPLDRWYEIGNVITIVDAGQETELSPTAAYLLGSEAACAGKILFSRSQETSEEKMQETMQYLDQVLKDLGCPRNLDELVMTKDWSEFTDEDFAAIITSGYVNASYGKLSLESMHFQTECFMNLDIDEMALWKAAERMFSTPAFGNVFRIKGFFKIGDQWMEYNATKKTKKITPISAGQDVLIIIGEHLVPDEIKKLFS